MCKIYYIKYQASRTMIFLSGDLLPLLIEDMFHKN